MFAMAALRTGKTSMPFNKDQNPLLSARQTLRCQKIWNPTRQLQDRLLQILRTTEHACSGWATCLPNECWELQSALFMLIHRIARLHLLRLAACGCVGEGGNSHQVVWIGVNALLHAQVQRCQQCLQRGARHRGDPRHSLPDLQRGSCTNSPIRHYARSYTPMLHHGTMLLPNSDCIREQRTDKEPATMCLQCVPSIARLCDLSIHTEDRCACHLLNLPCCACSSPMTAHQPLRGCQELRIKHIFAAFARIHLCDHCRQTFNRAPALEESLFRDRRLRGRAELRGHCRQRQVLADCLAAEAVPDLCARPCQERGDACHHQRHLRACRGFNPPASTRMG